MKKIRKSFIVGCLKGGFLMISDVIKDIRRRNYLNQTAFANKLGVTQGTVSQWENGLTRPNLDQLRSISSIFGVSIDSLLNTAARIFRLLTEGL